MIQLNRLSWANWQADARGGIAAAAVALPLAVAFGEVSGAGALAGLYGAICAGLMTSLFGGTPTQIAGPTGPIAITMAGIVAGMGGSPALAFAAVALAGVIQILFGVFRMGRYIRLMPYPVISGIVSGVGCIIISMQLPAAMGLPGQHSVTDSLVTVASRLGDANYQALLLTMITAAAYMAIPRAAAWVLPGPLVALLVGTLLGATLLTEAPRLTRPEQWMPGFSLPVMGPGAWEAVLLGALVIALLSSIDSLLTSMAADNATRRFHDPERELVGQGLGNLLAGLAGGVAGAGATSRTLTNVHGGGRTELSALVHALVLIILVVPVVLWIDRLPAAAVAGVLLRLGVGIIDWNYLGRLRHAPRAGAAVTIIVLLLAFLVSVVAAVVVGTFLASLIFIKRASDLQLESIEPLDSSSGDQRLSEAEKAALDTCAGRALLVNLQGPLGFGLAAGLTRKLSRAGKWQVLILDLDQVTIIDETAALTLEQIVQRAQSEGRLVILSGLKRGPAKVLLTFGLRELVKACVRVKTRLDALEYAVDTLDDTGHKTDGGESR